MGINSTKLTIDFPNKFMNTLLSNNVTVSTLTIKQVKFFIDEPIQFTGFVKIKNNAEFLLTYLQNLTPANITTLSTQISNYLKSVIEYQLNIKIDNLELSNDASTDTDTIVNAINIETLLTTFISNTISVINTNQHSIALRHFQKIITIEVNGDCSFSDKSIQKLLAEFLEVEISNSISQNTGSMAILNQYQLNINNKTLSPYFITFKF